MGTDHPNQNINSRAINKCSFSQKNVFSIAININQSRDDRESDVNFAN